jgi:hypothetical protein
MINEKLFDQMSLQLVVSTANVYWEVSFIPMQ